MENKRRAGIIGATGYAGVELIRLLLAHPGVELAGLCSVSFEGKKVSDVYPAFKNICDTVLTGEDDVIAACDVIFASVPHGVSEKLARKCVSQGKLLIDLGADFRLEEEKDYQQWYKLPYSDPELHAMSCYALPELFRDQVRKAKVIGNPGCYPTSIALGLTPAARAGIIDNTGIVIDSKSGVTGAGRGLTQNTHFPECNEAFSAYKVAAHRHTPEIEQTLSTVFGRKTTVTFVPHLLPVNRGIFSTIYTTLNQEIAPEEIHKIYTECYADEPFVRVLPLGQSPNIKDVRYSNYCDIAVFQDVRTGRLIILSVIDNMVKGAAGQAIQNMNIAFGLDETTGLLLVPPAI